MTRAQALALIHTALEKAGAQRTDPTDTSDLIEDGFVDSLDGMVMIMEIENATGRKLPEDIDLVEAGYYKVDKLIDFILG